ncbi:MAG: hypothetical protein R2874_03740 [Desulfobacterales bacterium]
MIQTQHLHISRFSTWAPSGRTDHIYRNTFARHFEGFDLAVAPFVKTVGTNTNPAQIRADPAAGKQSGYAGGNPSDFKQIVRKGFAHLANYLADLGYDTINWNLLPLPGGPETAGLGLLPHTDTIRQFLDTAIPKLRGGCPSKPEGRETQKRLFRLMPVFNNIPSMKSSFTPHRPNRCMTACPI